jgi:hypothetical protein
MRVAAGLSLKDLHAAFKLRLQVLAAAFPRFETKTDARAPQVIDGWLPPKAGIDAERFPYLILQPRSGADSEQSAAQDGRATFDVVLGTYSDTDDGYLDVLELIEAVRQDLGSQPTLAGTAFEQTGPLTWEIPEEQPRPQWIGRVTTNWTVPRPRRVEARNPEEG